MSGWEEKQEKKIREKKKEIKEQKKKLDKLWLDAKLTLKKLKNYLDFYKEDKLLSDEELQDLKSPINTLAYMIKPTRRETGRIGRLIESIKGNQREVKQIKKELEELEG